MKKKSKRGTAGSHSSRACVGLSSGPRHLLVRFPSHAHSSRVEVFKEAYTRTWPRQEASLLLLQQSSLTRSPSRVLVH